MSAIELSKLRAQLVDFRSKIQDSGLASSKDAELLLADAERIFRAAKRDIQTYQDYGDRNYAQWLGRLLKTAQKLQLKVDNWCSVELVIEKIQKACKQLATQSAMADQIVPPCPLVPLKEGELPGELFQMHFFGKRNTEKDWAALMRVDRKFNQTANSVLHFHWERLKRSTSGSLVDVKYLATCIEREFPGCTPLFYFYQLKQEFIHLGVDLSDRLPVTSSDFEELQKAIRPAYEKALRVIWQKASLDPRLDTAESISKWLNDPAHAKILRKIAALDLKGCELTILPYEIRFFTGLTFFNLLDNQLRFLPREMGALNKVVWLSVGNNQLRILPKEIGLLVELREFDASNNSIQNLPPEIGQLSNLNKLRLVQNNLTSLPPEIGSLHHLGILILYCNSLESLPPEIGSLISLQHLGLTANALKELPKEIGQLKQLRYLYVECNELESLPPEVGELTSLRHFDLHNNKLHSLPSEIGSLMYLENLHLEDNLLHFLPQALAHLGNLQNLTVHNNPIMFISDAILKSPNPCFAECTGIKNYNAELAYHPTSPLGKLYHSIITREKEDTIKQRFFSLNDKDKNLILGLLGAHIVFQDMPLFYHTVRAAILNKYWLYSAKIKNHVYDDIADQEEASAFANFTRLADAMDGHS